MSFIRQFSRGAGFVLAVAAVFPTITVEAQTTISNETLVTTTFVVSKEDKTAKCGKPDCRAKAPMFPKIQVICPAAIGQTCTFHISLVAKTSIRMDCGGCTGAGPLGYYQFLVDDAAPTIGPTDKQGNYLFEKNVFTADIAGVNSRQGYPTSVLAAVSNSTSQNHTVAVNFGCRDDLYGCETTTHWTTMRVDVFEP